jgi:hypothetical protein
MEGGDNMSKVPAGINWPLKCNGVGVDELKEIADKLATDAPNAYVVTSNGSHLNVVENETVIGRIELRNDLGFKGVQRLSLNK